MIRLVYFTPAKGLTTELTLEELPKALQDADGIVWVDFENTPPEEDEPILRELFGFHPLAIDDALQETHVPKIDDWDDYLYIVLQAVSLDDEQPIGDLIIEELDVFLGKQYMVTHHNQSIPAVEHLRDAVVRDHRALKNGADALLYRLVDEVVA
ncbi:MAG: corA, partial [Chloroflexi bacterium]|nr:corA [Chloroflexota bacterium]